MTFRRFNPLISILATLLMALFMANCSNNAAPPPASNIGSSNDDECSSSKKSKTKTKSSSSDDDDDDDDDDDGDDDDDFDLRGRSFGLADDDDDDDDDAGDDDDEDYGDDDDDDDDDDESSSSKGSADEDDYKSDVMEVMESYCYGNGCHDSGVAPDLSSWTKVKKADKEAIMDRVIDNETMPPEDELNASGLKTIEAWLKTAEGSASKSDDEESSSDEACD